MLYQRSQQLRLISPFLHLLTVVLILVLGMTLLFMNLLTLGVSYGNNGEILVPIEWRITSYLLVAAHIAYLWLPYPLIRQRRKQQHNIVLWLTLLLSGPVLWVLEGDYLRAWFRLFWE